MLKSHSERNRLLVLGLNSGTSMDSLDLVIARINRTTTNVSYKFLCGTSRKYPPTLHRLLTNIVDSNTADLEEMVRLDNALGDFMGRAAAGFLKKSQYDGKIHLVASHGQTIRHVPHKRKIGSVGYRGTLQIGFPQAIATETLLPVVADFRRADVALGNEGAPITVAAMWDIFRSEREPRLLLNIGGMSNYFYFPHSKDISSARARDCGPGNSVIDILVREFTGNTYDRNGSMALKGVISNRLLSLMLRHRFFISPQLSTGREEFGIDFARKIMSHGKKMGLGQDDIIATTSELTVEAVCRYLSPIVKRDRQIRKLYLTGGGRKNRFFVRRLSQRLAGIEVSPIDSLGVDGDYVEAFAYAAMGEKAYRGIPSPTRFSRKKQLDYPVLGSIVQPPLRLSRK